MDALFARLQSVRVYDEADNMFRKQPIRLVEASHLPNEHRLPRSFSKFAKLFADFSFASIQEGALVQRSEAMGTTIFELSANPWGAMIAAVESGMARKYYYSIYSYEKSARVPYNDHRVEEIMKINQKTKEVKHNDIRTVATAVLLQKEHEKKKIPFLLIDIPLHRNTSMALNFRILKEDLREQKDVELVDEMPLGKENAMSEHIGYLDNMETLVMEGGVYVFKIPEMLTARNVEQIYRFVSYYRNVNVYVSDYSSYFSKEFYFICHNKREGQEFFSLFKLLKAVTIVQSFLYERLTKRYEHYLTHYPTGCFAQRIISCRQSLYERPCVNVKNKRNILDVKTRYDILRMLSNMRKKQEEQKPMDEQDIHESQYLALLRIQRQERVLKQKKKEHIL